MTCCDAWKLTRGTTPSMTVEVDKDVSGLTLHLSFAQGDVLVVKKGEGGELEVETREVKGKTHTFVTARLTQEDTLQFDAGGDCEIQIRGYTDAGIVAMATTVATVRVAKILEEGVLPNDG